MVQFSMSLNLAGDKWEVGGGSGWGEERADGCCAFVELEIARFALVALRYQPHLNPRSRSYSVYGLTISTNYHYSIHNSRYSTLNCLDRLHNTKQTKSDLYFHNVRIVPYFLIV